MKLCGVGRPVQNFEYRLLSLIMDENTFELSKNQDPEVFIFIFYVFNKSTELSCSTQPSSITDKGAMGRSSNWATSITFNV